MNINLLDYLDGSVERFPEKVAFVGDNEQITFRELKNKAQIIGTYLCKITEKNEPISVITEKGIETIIVYLGVLYAGCFYAAVDKEMPATRISTIIELTDAGIILTDDKSVETAEKFSAGRKVVTVGAILNDAKIDESILSSRRTSMIDTDPAYMIFTSGSTGVPKGVVGSHRALIDYIDAITDAYDLSDADILGNQSPLDYIAGVRDIYLPLKNGACTYLIPKVLYGRPAELFDFLNENKINTIFWVAPALSLCAELGTFKEVIPQYLNKIIFTGSVMPCKHLRIWQDNIPDALYVNQYGPTEITASCTYYVVDHLVEANETLPIGKPFVNTEILLLDEDGQLVKDGEQGEICVRGTSLALGYYKQPEKTKEVYVVNPVNKMYEELIYKTGDIGRLNEDGNIEFFGRIDNQIKHMGHRVELSEIEVAAGGIEALEHCVCLYHFDKQNIYLFYVGEATNRDIAIHLRNVLPAFMVPRKFVKLDEMPLLFNGKYDRNKLKELMK